VVKGCEAAGCKLTGGETAEMPDMYSPDDIDLAGFCAGVGERDALLPKLHEIVAGDSLLGLPSNGVHSNGLSLARKVLSGISDWEQLLLPTKIYVEEVSLLLESRRILGAAHITGGGLTGNILRVLPSHLYPNLEYDWPCPLIFQKIQERGKIEDQEMRRTFNMGIGLVLVVSSQFENEILALAAKSHISLLRIGRVLDRRGESRE
ncbi:MAG TPA: phosphoribosylformylglycinamidine cyclo-ligase, partial [Spirochaetia bacterium]|nr:phosphoribosylformylglycinamidine cyclo-ligase [Spirochaetia bacterium]